MQNRINYMIYNIAMINMLFNNKTSTKVGDYKLEYKFAFPDPDK